MEPNGGTYERRMKFFSLVFDHCIRYTSASLTQPPSKETALYFSFSVGTLPGRRIPFFSHCKNISLRSPPQQVVSRTRGSATGFNSPWLSESWKSTASLYYLFYIQIHPSKPIRLTLILWQIPNESERALTSGGMLQKFSPLDCQVHCHRATDERGRNPPNGKPCLERAVLRLGGPEVVGCHCCPRAHTPLISQ